MCTGCILSRCRLDNALKLHTIIISNISRVTTEITSEINPIVTVRLSSLFSTLLLVGLAMFPSSVSSDVAVVC